MASPAEREIEAALNRLQAKLSPYTKAWYSGSGKRGKSIFVMYRQAPGAEATIRKIAEEVAPSIPLELMPQAGPIGPQSASGG